MIKRGPKEGLLQDGDTFHWPYDEHNDLLKGVPLTNAWSVLFESMPAGIAENIAEALPRCREKMQVFHEAGFVPVSIRALCTMVQPKTERGFPTKDPPYKVVHWFLDVLNPQGGDPRKMVKGCR